ncbi:MAG: hypothetical protein ACOY3P_03640 [Planctomycetota bacterium]
MNEQNQPQVPIIVVKRRAARRTRHPEKVPVLIERTRKAYKAWFLVSYGLALFSCCVICAGLPLPGLLLLIFSGMLWFSVHIAAWWDTG